MTGTRRRRRVRRPGARALLTGIGVVVIASALTVTALIAPGYPAQKVELDDAAVWITSDLHQAVARANPLVGELNTAVGMASGSLSVSQAGQHVVVVDAGGAEGRIVDTASAQVADTFPLPAGDVEVGLTGGTAVITALGSGEVWVIGIDRLASFDPSAEPDLSLGRGGRTAVSTDGVLYAVSAATGSVVAVDLADGQVDGRPDARRIEVAESDDLGITAVGSRWVVLDRSSGRLLTADGAVSVDLRAGAGAGAVQGTGVAPGGAEPDDDADASGDDRADSVQSWLQGPSESADEVMIATPGALLRVGLADGSTDILSDGHSGTSTAPVQVDGCWYAGWTDGRTWTGCDADDDADGVGDPKHDRSAEVSAMSRAGDVAGTGRPSVADGGADGALVGAASGDRLVFRTNGTGGLLLSDAATGRAWDVTRGNAVIDDWDALLPDPATATQSAATTADDESDPDTAQQPPTATDDELGARPGRSSILPVLLNDFDPNDDVIVIDRVTLPDGARYTVDLISDDQQLQLTVPEGFASPIEFGYSISDGRGGTADAVVRVALRGQEVNEPPVQTRQATLDLALGGRGDLDVRSDWYDPDGDAFYVQSATLPAPGTVTWTPEGTVTVTDPGQATGSTAVAVTVSDGVASTVGSFTAEVHPPDEVPLRAQGFVVLARVGQPIDITPLEHVEGAGTDLRLASLPERDGFVIAPDYAGGTARITALAAGTATLDYGVGDGSRSATGSVRVVATLPPDANARPVTVPHSAFARPDSSVLVDVLAGDFDPAGGVLIISEADGGAGAGDGADPGSTVDTGSTSSADGDTGSAGLLVDVIEQRMLRVTLTGPLENGRAAFSYTVTNGLSEARGTVTVVELPEPASRQPPVAVADTASVRVGDVVDIPVLVNDVHPDGDPLTVDPEPVRLPDRDSGLLFVSGDRLRFLAPETPGEVTVGYRVEAPDGQWATAEVRISVREADAAANAAPVPTAVTARVIAGETVRIPVPLTGIDPDGDSVQFLGIDSVPEKGTVLQNGSDAIEYRAGEYSTGTDTFSYTVTDRLGAKASGSVRVGIAPRPDGARNPVATPDEARVRPGRTVLLPVLDNDSAPDGSPLEVTSVEPAGTPPDGTSGGTDGAAPRSAAASVLEGGLLRVEAPETPGRYGFVYSIADERGGSSSTFATIDVDPDAPLARPVVQDTRLTLNDILDRRTVDVDVLANVFFAEGSSSTLTLTVGSGADGAARVVDGRIRMPVQRTAQVVPFTVSHPDDPTVRSSGFVWVPGSDDALPQLRPGTPALRTLSGAELRIEVDDYVVAVGGRAVRVVDPTTVRATHADGSALTADDRTLVFRSADRYFGPASISFEVVDGDGPSARRATLVLPITVEPREDQPPSFAGATLPFEPGQQKTIDLSRLTTSATAAPLTFSLADTKPAGFDAVLMGATLTVTAGVGSRPGSSGELGILVSAGESAATEGRIAVSVVPSTRPLAALADDSVIAPRGRTTEVDVLANDAAGNPFPETALRVVSVRGLDRSRLPAGVDVTPGAGGVLRVAVTADAPAADLVLQYQVVDGTGELSRAVWGTVRVAVIDRPAPVTQLAVTGFGDRTVGVSFSPGPANNSPISGFEVQARTASGAVTTTRCASTDCDIRTPGNGPGNAVTVSVVALNEVGPSDARAYAVPVWSDLLPSAPGTPQLVPLDGALDVLWAPAEVPAGGSGVRQYDVTANGVGVATIDAGGCDGSGCRTRIGGLQNGSSVNVVVTARNGAYPPLAVWPSAEATGVPYGAPVATTVTAVATPEAGPGTVVLSWPEFSANGSPVAGYYAQALAPGAGVPTGAQACAVSEPAPGRPTAPTTGGSVLAQQAFGAGSGDATFTGLTDVDAAYGFVVWGYNAAGCVATPVATAVAYPSPGQVQAAAVQVAMVQTGTTLDAQVLSAPVPGPLSPDARYYVRQVDDAGAAGERVPVSIGGFPRSLTGGAFGQVYRFQLQACSRWGGAEVCGAFSDTVSAPEPSLTFAFRSGPRYDGTSWTWSGEPENGRLVPVYVCGSDQITPAGEGGQVLAPGSCTPVTPAPVGSAGLLVQIGERHYVYRG